VNPYTNEPFYDRHSKIDHYQDGEDVRRMNSTAEGRGLMVVEQEELANRRSNPAGNGTETHGTDSGTPSQPGTAVSPEHDASFIAGTRGPLLGDSTGASTGVTYSSNPVSKGEDSQAGGLSNGTAVVPGRPAAGVIRTDSNLHVPGEYPKSMLNL